MGGVSHLIPLINLHRQLRRDVESAFFLSEPMRKQHGTLLKAAFGLTILRADHNYTISSELAAYSEFLPTVVVDDTDLATAYARQSQRVPRVTILRTGVFPNMSPTNPQHSHSMGHTAEQLPSVERYGFETYRRFGDFFQAEAWIVPGIRSVEVVDETLKGHPRCYFSGPLILDDMDVVPRQPLEEFFRRNGGRRRVYLTYGVMQARDAPAAVVDGIRYMLERGIAVVSNVEAGRSSLLEAFPSTYFNAAYLPMHYVCSNVDLVFHHCGSGTYHYPLLHNRFSVTLGTQKYDREDVALELERLGVAKHIPSPLENPDFVHAFRACVDRYVIHADYDRAAVQSKLHVLREEILRTQAEFDFMRVLESVPSLDLGPTDAVA
jgi:hypothetical protein